MDTPQDEQPSVHLDMRGRASISVQAGIVHGGVTVNAVEALPLEVAELDYAPVLAGATVDRFTGREWLLKRIEESDSGYVLVAARAGMGKTALAAHLAREWDCPRHFTQGVPRGGDTAVALRSLAAQLIRRYGLEEPYASGGMLASWVADPAYFPKVLAAAAERAGTVRVVVDGLDEAANADGPALGLPDPHALPPGVQILATYREGTDPARLPDGPNVTRVRIEADDPNNRDDIQRFLAVRAEEPAIAAWLDGQGISPREFTRVLAERSEGVWVYLRYALEEVRRGTWDRAAWNRLPVGLAAYYRQQLTARRARPDFATRDLPLLATLAVAQQPMPLEQLARLADLDPGTTTTLCDARYQPFLTVDTTTPQPRYAIYHASLREFLHGNATEDPLERARLREAVQAAHHRIADHYLTTFGGLADGLPALAAAPALAEQDDRYALRHLPTHLATSGREDDLHALLTCPMPTPDALLGTVWADAHDRAGTLDVYLSGLDTARRAAERRTDQSLAAGRPAAAFLTETEYALLAAQLVSRSNAIPFELLARLVETGAWDADRALSHALRLHDATERAGALVRVLPHLTDPAAVERARQEAFTTALDAAGKEGDLSGLVKLLPYLDRAGLHETLKAALTLPAGRREFLVGHLAARLDGEARERAVQAAVEAMAEARDAMSGSGWIGDVLPYLTDAQLGRALTLAETVMDPVERARLLGVLASRVGAARIARQALAPHDSAPPGDRAAALALVSDHLAGAHRTLALDRALDTVSSLNDTRDRAWKLGTVASRLDDAGRLDRAFALAVGLPTGMDQFNVLSELVPRLTHHHPLPRVMRRIPDAWMRSVLGDVLAARSRGSGISYDALEAAVRTAPDSVPPDAVARNLIPLLGPRGIDQALDALIGHERGRGDAPRDPVAPHLWKVLDHVETRHLDRALEWAEGMGPAEERTKGDILWKVSASHPSPSQLDRALTVAAGFLDERRLYLALSSLARRLDAPQARRALGIVITGRGDQTRELTRALTTLGARLQGPLRDQALKQAGQTMNGVSDEHQRLPLLADLAVALSGPERARLVDHLLDVMAANGSMEALATIVPHLDAARLDRALDVVTRQGWLVPMDPLLPRLDAAQLHRLLDWVASLNPDATDDQGGDRAEALVRLVPYLSAGHLVRALDIAATIEGDEDRASVFVELAPHLDAAESRRALAIAEGCSAAQARARAMAALARGLAEPRRQSVLASAVRWATLDHSHPVRNALALAQVAAHLPEPRRSRALGEAARIATALPDRWTKVTTLARLAAHLDGGQRAEAARLAAEVFSWPDSIGRLADLLPHLDAHQRDAVLDAALAKWTSRWTWGGTGELAPHLSAEQIGRVLWTAITEEGTETAVVYLAPYLNAAQLHRVQEALLAERQWHLSLAHERIFTRLATLGPSATPRDTVTLLRRLYRALPPQHILLSAIARATDAIEAAAGSETPERLYRAVALVTRPAQESSTAATASISTSWLS